MEDALGVIAGFVSLLLGNIAEEAGRRSFCHHYFVPSPFNRDYVAFDLLSFCISLFLLGRLPWFSAPVRPLASFFFCP